MSGMNYFSWKSWCISYSKGHTQFGWFDPSWKYKKCKYVIIIGILCVWSLLLFGVYFLKFNKHAGYANYELRQFQHLSLTNKNLSTYKLQKIIMAQRNHIGNQLAEATGLLASDTYENDYLSKFTFEKGGTPLRIFLASNRRSGSTFTQKLLNSIPGLVSYFEPVRCLMNGRGPVTIHDGSPLIEEARSFLKDLYQCGDNAFYCLEDNFAGLKIWTSKVENDHICNRHTMPYKYCRSAQYMKGRCKMAPFLAVKEVHVALKHIEELLRDDSLNLKVVYLIRDPRGVMNSRYHYTWPAPTEECMNFTFLCSRIDDDFKTAKIFTEKYPDKFRVVRYEDMTLDPLVAVGQLMHFLGFKMHSSIVNFVEKVTKSNPSHWRNKLSFRRVIEIQKVCAEAMQSWGYNLVTNQRNLTDTNFHIFAKSPFNL